MLTLDILGVEEDGRNRSPLVPNNVRTSLRWTLQTDVLVRLKALYPDGSPRDLTGCTLTIAAKKTPGVGATLFTVVADPSTISKNTVEFTLTGKSQASWASGWYVWGVWCTNPGVGGARVQLVPASPLLLDPVLLAV